MQPLFSSTDYESRHSSYRATEESISPVIEQPLLGWPQQDVLGDRRTKITVSLLLVLLITGVVIGIYQLVLQYKSENVLPPVQAPTRMISLIRKTPTDKMIY